MKTSCIDNVIREAFEKNGIKDLYGDDIPVMFKKKFVLDEVTEISAGTLACIKYLLSDTAEEDWVSFTLRIAFPEFPVTTFGNEDTFHCILNLDDGVITVKGMYKDIPLSKLLAVADTDATAVMNEFWEKRREYQNKEHKWLNFNFVRFMCSFFLSFVFMWLLCRGVTFDVLSMLNPLFWISLTIIVMLVFTAIFSAYISEYEETKAGKVACKQLKDIYTELTELGEKLSKQNKSGNS